jgi:hypothetical protein
MQNQERFLIREPFLVYGSLAWEYPPGWNFAASHAYYNRSKIVPYYGKQVGEEKWIGQN